MLSKKILDNLTGPERMVNISSEVLSIFERHPWPGNIRQMHNILRTALALLGEGKEITVDELSEDFMEQAVCGNKGGNMSEEPSDGGSCEVLLADVEARFISSTLERASGNIAAAARIMGIGRNTLYRKLRGVTGEDCSPITNHQNQNR